VRGQGSSLGFACQATSPNSTLRQLLQKHYLILHFHLYCDSNLAFDGHAQVGIRNGCAGDAIALAR
jgi:hypothetical protein